VMTKKQQRNLEERLLSPDQLRALRALDERIRRSNQRFYDNMIVIDPGELDKIEQYTFGVLGSPKPNTNFSLNEGAGRGSSGE